MDGYYEQRDIKKKKMKKCGTLEMAIRMEIPNVYLLFTFSSSPFSFIYVSPSHSSHTINGKYTFGISILIAISNVPHFFIFFLFISLLLFLLLFFHIQLFFFIIPFSLLFFYYFLLLFFHIQLFFFIIPFSLLFFVFFFDYLPLLCLSRLLLYCFNYLYSLYLFVHNNHLFFISLCS